MLLFGSLLLTASAYGTNIRLVSDLAYTETKSESEDRLTGDVEESETNRFQQTYRLDLNKEIFPTLNMNTGVQVEQDRSTIEADDGSETKNRNRQILPYVDLEWRNSLYSLSGGYRERYAQSKGDSVTGTEKDYVTSYNLRGEWRPVEFPRVEFSYLHSESYDDPLTSKTESDTWLLNTRYEYQDYSFRYNFLRGVNSNKISQTEATTNTHSGEARFIRSFLDGKINLNSSIRMEYTTQEFTGNETFIDVDRALLGTGFFLVSSGLSPEEDRNNYSNFPSNSNPDLGNVALGGNFAAGVDFTDDVNIDKIRLLATVTNGSIQAVSDIVDDTNWTVYFLNDADNWEQFSGNPIDTIEYDSVDSYIEFTFDSEVSVSKSILLFYQQPGPPSGPSVVITGITAIDTVAVEEGSELTNQTYQAQLGIGWQATESTRLSYTFNLQERRSSLFDERKTRITNGLSLSHIFNEIFTGTARVSSGHNWDQGALDTSNYSYSARLSGRYLDTLNQSLIYSGSLTQDEDDGDSTTNALILRTNAALYDGWDVSFDQGTTWQDSDSDGDSSGYFVRLQTSVVPHSSYSLFAEYSIDWDVDDDGTERSDTGRFRALWVPRDTLSFSGEVRVRRTADDDQLTWQYSASWLPLRDGSLQCVLAYSQEEDKDGNQTWSFSPSLTWDVTHYATLSLRYSRGEQETDEDINQFETAFLNFRIFYDN